MRVKPFEIQNLSSEIGHRARVWHEFLHGTHLFGAAGTIFLRILISGGLFFLSNHILFSESSKFRAIVVQVLKQVVVTDAVVTICWPYESRHFTL